jgi:hypothetical protein
MLNIEEVLKVRANKLVVRGNMQFLDIALSIYENRQMGMEHLRNPSALFKKLQDFLSNNVVLSIHIRLRDYVTLEDSTQLSEKYYSDAISNVTKNQVFDQIWIFSDDIESAKHFMKSQVTKSNIVFHDENDLNDCETMVLISLSNAIIAANSTFSLWSCILSESSNKYVPSPWFKNKDGSTASDFKYPKGWNVIDW